MSAPVTVVIPTYNGAAFLGPALCSVFAQTAPPRSVVVVDDCSTDGTADLAERLSAAAPVPVTVVRLPANSGGPTGPMNAGVELADGVVVTLDQDDLMAPTRIADQTAVLAAHPDVPAVFGLLEKIDADGRPLEPDFAARSRERVLGIAHRAAPDCYLLDPAAFYAHVLTAGTLTIASSTAFRRSAWDALGGFARGLRVAWDLDFSCRLASLGPVAYLDRVVGAYRLHGANTSARGLTCYREVLAVHRAQLDRPLFPVPAGFRRDVGERYFGLGYHESAGGHFGRAVAAYRAALAHGVPVRRVAPAVVKAAVRGLKHRLVGRRDAK